MHDKAAEKRRTMVPDYDPMEGTIEYDEQRKLHEQSLLEEAAQMKQQETGEIEKLSVDEG